MTSLPLKFISEENFWHLTEGLTYTTSDLEVLDNVLGAFNRKTGFINQIIAGNRIHGFQHKVDLPGNQYLINLDTYINGDKKKLSTATILLNKQQDGLPPMLLLNLKSPSLQVPQRIEIPLKYILKGLPSLKGTHMVYLHTIEINNGQKFDYYGRTKRGWMKRYLEHVKLALKGSNRLFPALYGQAIRTRYQQLDGQKPNESNPVYTGSNHVVCVAGIKLQEAIEIEHYLINKYSRNSETGLNMV